MKKKVKKNIRNINIKEKNIKKNHLKHLKRDILNIKINLNLLGLEEQK